MYVHCIYSAISIAEVTICMAPTTFVILPMVNSIYDIQWTAAVYVAP